MGPETGGGRAWVNDGRTLQSGWSAPGSRYHERLGCGSRCHGGGDAAVNGEWFGVEPTSIAVVQGPPSPKPYTAAAVSETGNGNGFRSTSPIGDRALTCDIVTNRHASTTTTTMRFLLSRPGLHWPRPLHLPSQPWRSAPLHTQCGLLCSWNDQSTTLSGKATCPRSEIGQVAFRREEMAWRRR